MFIPFRERGHFKTRRCLPYKTTAIILRKRKLAWPGEEGLRPGRIRGQAAGAPLGVKSKPPTVDSASPAETPSLQPACLRLPIQMPSPSNVP